MGYFIILARDDKAGILEVSVLQQHSIPQPVLQLEQVLSYPE